MRSLLATVVMVALLVPVISAQQREVSRERTFEDLLVVVGLDQEEEAAREEGDPLRVLSGLEPGAGSGDEERAAFLERAARAMTTVQEGLS